MEWEKACEAAELPPFSKRLVRFPGLELLIVRLETRLYAVGARCPHLGVGLVDGDLEAGSIRCRAHGYRMELDSGRCLTEAGLTIPTYPVEIRDGSVWVRVGA